MRRVFVLLPLFFMVQCHINSTQQPILIDSTQQPILPTENSQPLSIEYYRAQIKSMDTLTARGNYLHYSIDDSSNTIITWGSKKTGDIGTFMSERYPGWSPHWYLNEWKNYIGLRYSCGSPCWSLTLLPLNKKDSILNFMEDFACDTARGFIFCRSYKENELFCLVNVNTGREKEIKLKDIDMESLMMGAVDSCAFVKKGLYVRWNAVMNVEPFAETREKIFTLNY